MTAHGDGFRRSKYTDNNALPKGRKRVAANLRTILPSATLSRHPQDFDGALNPLMRALTTAANRDSLSLESELRLDRHDGTEYPFGIFQRCIFDPRVVSWEGGRF